jgi:hypothetical protein
MKRLEISQMEMIEGGLFPLPNINPCHLAVFLIFMGTTTEAVNAGVTLATTAGCVQ